MPTIFRSPRYQRLWAAILLLGCLTFTFRDVVFHGRTFLMLTGVLGTMPRESLVPQNKGEIVWGYPEPVPTPGRNPVLDTFALAQVNEPCECYTRATLHAGEMPLWNPHVGGGEPHLAVGQASVLDPLSLPIHLTRRAWFPAAYDLAVLLRRFFMGWFTYLFARRLTGQFWPSLFAATAMLLLGYAMNYGHAPVKVVAMVPLLFYALDRLVERQSLGNIALAAAAVALTVVADFAEMTFLAFQLSAVYCLLAGGLRLAAHSDWKRQAVRLAAGGVASVVLGLALSAPMLVPLLENLRESESLHDETSQASSITYPRGQWYLMLFPQQQTHDDRQPTSCYASVFLLALAAPWVFSREKGDRHHLCEAPSGPFRQMVPVPFFRPTTVQGLLGLFFLACGAFYLARNMGLPGTGWLGALPLYRQINLARYLPPLVEFCLAIAAATAIAALLRRPDACRVILGAAILFLGFAAVLACKAQPSDTPTLPIRSCLLLGMPVALIAGLCVAHESFRLKSWVLGAGLVACLVAEVNLAYANVGRPLRCDPFTAPPFVDFLRAQGAGFRVFGTHEILMPNVACAYRIDDVRYNSGLAPKRRRIYRHLYCEPMPSEITWFMGNEPVRWNRYLNLLNVRYVMAVWPLPFAPQAAETERPVWSSTPESPGPVTPPAAQFEQVYENEIRIYRNNWAYPRSFVVYRAELAAGVQDAAQRLSRATFAPCREVVLEAPDSSVLAPELSSGREGPPGDVAEVVGRTANTLTIRATARASGVLVVSETYFPGWTAYVDGRPAPVYPADVMLRGVPLDAGEHEIRLVYAPWSYRLGLALAAGAALILAGCGVWRLLWGRGPAGRPDAIVASG